MDEPLRHRQTKGAETDMLGLTSPRHIPTLPIPEDRHRARKWSELARDFRDKWKNVFVDKLLESKAVSCFLDDLKTNNY
jgi:hypothetical protein